jgi:hypothetical protein
MVATRSPEQLMVVAQRCRFLAASCITSQARQPLTEMADELEAAADQERADRERLIGSALRS